MRTLNLEKMTDLTGGGSVVGNMISGACTAGGAWTLAASLKLVAAIAVPSGVGNAIAVVCIGNWAGQAAGWW